MTTKLRQALDYIDGILVHGDATAKGLWAVMTALRGPDKSDTYFLKRGTTVVIRRAAFPRTAARQGRGLPASFGMPGNVYRLDQTWAGAGGKHFKSHIEGARRVLRLK